MKKKGFLSPLTEGLVVLLLAIGGIGCLVSGFHLQVDPWPLYAGIAFWCILGTLAGQSRRGYVWLLVLSGLWLGHSLMGSLDANAKTLFIILGKHYHAAYRWDVAGLFSGTSAEILKADVTASCRMLGCLIGIVASQVICRGKNLCWCLPAVLLPLSLTLVVTDTVGSPGWIALFLLGMSLLLMTQGLRRREPRQAGKLTALLLLPLTLCVGLLLYTNPKGAYTPPDLKAGFLSFLYDRVQDLPFLEFGGSGLSSGRVNLDQLGSKSDSHEVVMTVTSSQRGLVYLRGQSYSHYTGLRWTTSGGTEWEKFTANENYLQNLWQNGDEGYGEYPVDTLTIQTMYLQPVEFVPYYPGDDTWLQRGKLLNDQNKTQFTIRFSPLKSDWKRLWQADHPKLSVGSNMGAEMDPFLELPENTYLQAQDILEQVGITKNMSIIDAADRIADYVRHHGTYSLDPQKIPWTESDFALWFLTQADSGYCVHYATAAAVLLRAAGIPARYVEGYTAYFRGSSSISGLVGKTAEVTDSMAHSWVEYYLPDLGWVMLEATPSRGVVTPPNTQTQPTVPSTSLPESTASTAPTTTAPTLPPDSTGNTTLPPLTKPTSTAPTTTAPTAGTTIPGTGPSGGNDLPLEPPWQQTLGDFLKILAAIGSVIAAVVLQRWLRVKLKRYLVTRGTTNQQALRRWKYARYLSKVTRVHLPKQLKDLANKAKFSQHTITEAELAVFDAFFDALTRRMRGGNFVNQLLYGFVLAIY